MISIPNLLASYYQNSPKETKLKSLQNQLNSEEFDREVLLFNRLLYKSKNQHRRSLHYRKLQFVKRIAERIAGFKEKLLSKGETLIEFVSDHKHLLGCLKDYYALLSKSLEVLMDAYQNCRKVAAQSYFMAVMLSFMAICAKIHKLVNTMMMSIDELYVILRNSFGIMIEQRNLTVNVKEWPSSLATITNLEIPKLAEQELEYIDELPGNSHESTIDKPTIVPVIKNHPSRNLQPATETKKEKTKKKKKSKSKDEIDDIFSMF